MEDTGVKQTFTGEALIKGMDDVLFVICDDLNNAIV